MFERPVSYSTSSTVTAGHWTDVQARTGCTVLLFGAAVPAVVDVRGGAPGTRETDLLGPGQLVQSVDAILLTGGSAFGLEAAGGVMSHLQEQGRGVETSAGPVPIVPAAVIFDLSVGASKWPTAESARQACREAGALAELPRGLIGAGTGATTRKLFADVSPSRGGIGLGRIDLGEHASVSALAVVNSAGDVLTGMDQPDRRFDLLATTPPASGREATTLVVVIVDAEVDDRTLRRSAAAAHTAIARKILPSHTIFDGDIVFAVGLRSGRVEPASVLRYSVAVELAVERAIIDAVTA